VIKAVREVTSLGLKEAKDLVTARPSPSRKACPGGAGSDFEEIDRTLGAKAEIK